LHHAGRHRTCRFVSSLQQFVMAHAPRSLSCSQRSARTRRGLRTAIAERGSHPVNRSRRRHRKRSRSHLGGWLAGRSSSSREAAAQIRSAEDGHVIHLARDTVGGGRTRSRSHPTADDLLPRWDHERAHAHVDLSCGRR
jgi:hypothetical protein